MPGRKQPKLHDDERRWEYRTFEKRAAGEVSPHSGIPAEVAAEREEWRKKHEERHPKRS